MSARDAAAFDAWLDGYGDPGPVVGPMPAERDDWCGWCGDAPCSHPHTADVIRTAGPDVRLALFTALLLGIVLGALAALLVVGIAQ